MDKAEYHQKLEELVDCVERSDYEGALSIVDEIDWKRVKSIRTLNMVADVYERNREYEKEKDILKIAYSRSSIGRNILYRLVEVCLKLGEIDEAEQYFKDFSEVAKNDNSRCILQYKLYRAKKAPLEAQIAVLEEYREREYTERWAYELALLYSRAGDEEKCVDACDDLILWFGEGRYVRKAMELKMQYKPLLPSQKVLYQKELDREKAAKEAAAQKKKAKEEAAAQEASVQETPVPEAEAISTEPEETTVPEAEAISTEPEETTVPEAEAISTEPEETTVPEAETDQASKEAEEISRELREAEIPEAEKIAEEPAIEEVPVTEETAEEPVSAEAPASEEIVEEPAGAEAPAAEETAEEPVNTEAPATEETVEEPAGAETPEAEKAAEEPETVEAPEAEETIEEPESAEAPESEDSEEALYAEPDEEEQPKKKHKGFFARAMEALTLRSEEDEEDSSAGAAEPADEPEQEESEESVRIIDETRSPAEKAADAETKSAAEAARGENPDSFNLDAFLKETMGEFSQEIAAGDFERQDEISAAEVPATTEKDIRAFNDEIEKAEKAFHDNKEEAPETAGAIDLDAKEQETEEAAREARFNEELEVPDDEEEVKTGFVTGITERIWQAGLNAADLNKDKESGTAEETEETAAAEQKDVTDQNTAAEQTDATDEAPAADQTAAAETAESAEIAQKKEDMLKAAEEAAAKRASEEAAKKAAAEAAEKRAAEEAAAKKAAEEAAAHKPKYNPELEVPDPEPTESEKKSRTIPLSKIGENTVPISLDQVMSEETPEERRIRILNKRNPTRMSDEQRKIFTYFARIPGMDSQILEAMNGVYQHAGEKTSSHGNIAVMGAKGTGKTRLTHGLVVAMCKDLELEAAKVARISGGEMNQKDPAKIVSTMAGGFLIIEEAGEMSEKTIHDLNRAMDFRTDCMILIIEDEKTPMRKMLKDYPEFAGKFDKVINIPVFTNDELVTFARTYATENGCKIDELGILALYTRIGNNQTEEEPVTISQVKDMVDSAINHATHGRRRSRHDKNRKAKWLILHEKDFEHN